MAKFSIAIFDKKAPTRFINIWEDLLKRINKWTELKIYYLSPSTLKNESSSRIKDFNTYSKHQVFIGNHLVLLDEKGQLLTTAKFSKKVENWESENINVTFLIGPSYGLDERWQKLQKMSLSLSPLTFPHDFAQILLLEQFYRAYSIIKKHPYHCAH